MSDAFKIPAFRRASRGSPGAPHPVVQIQDDNRQVVLSAKGDRCRIHDAEVAGDDFVEGNVGNEPGVGIARGIGRVYTLHLGRLDDHVGVHLDGPEHRGRVGGEVGVPGPSGEDHDPVLLEVPHGAAADVGLGQLRHPDGRHDPRVDSLLLEQILHGQRVHDRGQHSHVVRRNAIHPALAGDGPADDVPAPDHEPERNADIVNRPDLVRDVVHDPRVDPEAALPARASPDSFRMTRS